MIHARRYLGIPLAATLIVLVVGGSALAFGDKNSKNLNKAEKALKSGDFERAEQIYRELLAKDDHDLLARLGLSRTLLKLRRLQDAFDHAARVVAVRSEEHTSELQSPYVIS